MRITSARIGLFVVAGGLFGCQAIAGTENRVLDPLPEVCTLPSEGAAKVRLANFVPDDTLVDICIRPSGGAYGRPVLRQSGTTCARNLGRTDAGYAYSEVSVPFASPAGKIDVRIVKAGDTCSGAALTESTGLDVAAGATTTLVRYGNETLGTQIHAYQDDESNAAPGSQKLRLVHAAPGVPALNFGIADNAQLPATVGVKLTGEPIAYGTSTNSGTKPGVGFGHVNAQGYIDIPGAALNIGAATEASTKALLVASMPTKESGRTVYAIGDPSKPFFQVRGLVCNDAEHDPSTLKTTCTLSPLGTISIDVFNAYLYGRFAPDEDARRPAVIDAIAGRDSDLMCIVSLDRQKDKDAVINAAKAKGFLYSYYSVTDQHTPANDPADQNGKVPTPDTTAPCAGTNDPAQVEAIIACVQSHCSATGASTDMLSTPYDSTCMSKNCAAEFIALLGGDRDHGRCYSCLTTATVSDNTFDDVRQKCGKTPEDYFSFDGVTDSIILSRFPLTNTESYILPSTGFRRNVHYANAEIEKGKFVDFYCGELSAAFGDLVPYTGFYAPAMGVDGWYQEQRWQAQKVVDYVKRKSGKKPAIITGDWAVSREYKDMMGMTIIDDQDGQAFDILEATGNFLPALPKDFTPRCTECATPTNPYNGSQNIWQFKTYVYNLPATSGVEVNYWGTDINAVDVGGGVRRPISDRWGYNTRVLRP